MKGSHTDTLLMGSLILIIYAGAMTGIYQLYCESSNRLLPSPVSSPPSLLQLLFSLLTFFHARINPCEQHPWGVANWHDYLVYVRLTVCNALSQDLTGPNRPSSIYGITWLQVYSYYTTRCSRDRWPLKSFVRAPTCSFPCSGS